MKNNKTTIVKRPVTPRARALSLWVAWPTRPGIRPARNGRFLYDPNKDEIAAPATDVHRIAAAAGRIAMTGKPCRSIPDAAFWRDFFHECGHALGHKSRLARDLYGRRGTRSYAEEEICAEYISAAICEWCGFRRGVRARERYIDEWCRQLVDRRHREGNDPGPVAANERARANASRAVAHLFAEIEKGRQAATGKGVRA